uniref:Uncharacterized protein n=1 Tax=Anguilla anguilla TaxID=7936 RepID=A0A0E9TMA5_ANGAN
MRPKGADGNASYICGFHRKLRLRVEHTLSGFIFIRVDIDQNRVNKQI